MKEVSSGKEVEIVGKTNGYIIAVISVEDELIVWIAINAIALHKRLRLLRETNPYERTRIKCHNPAYYREYTKTELEQMRLNAGLEMIHHEFGNYRPAPSFVLPRSKSQMFDVFCRMIPAFCLGQTAVYRNLSARECLT